MSDTNDQLKNNQLDSVEVQNESELQVKSNLKAGEDPIMDKMGVPEDSLGRQLPTKN